MFVLQADAHLCVLVGCRGSGNLQFPCGFKSTEQPPLILVGFCGTQHFAWGRQRGDMSPVETRMLCGTPLIPLAGLVCTPAV